MNSASEVSSKAVSSANLVDPIWPILPSTSAVAPANVTVAWTENLIDAFQRSVVFLELPRWRDNAEIEIISLPTAVPTNQ